MPSVRVNRRPVPRSRDDIVLDALTAAGVPTGRGMLPTIDLPYHGLAAKAYYDAVLAAGFTEVTGGSWPCETALTDVGEVLHRSPSEGVYRLDDGTIAHVSVGDTWLAVKVAVAERAHGQHVMAAFQQRYPPLYLSRDDEAGVVVPITFWMLGAFGPERRLRRIAATTWETVEGNYTADVRGEMERLTSPGFQPGAEGQLLLWYGPPGTGKTWAVRALADEWSSWAEFHVITDPDAFFVKNASYMVDVLLHESYEAIDAPTGDLVSAEAGEKWRVLVLEDTGELLSADAKDKAGQGMSRLLNVVDGMIGQGLRILVLVTTNDEIETLHPAVQRAGRCASKLVFGPLSAAEASEWLDQDVDEPMTLADLYAHAAADPAADPPEEAFAPDPDEPTDDLTADAYPGAFFGDLDPLTQAAVDAARGPLPDLAPEPDPAPAEAVADAVEALRATGDAPDATVVAALEAVAAAHYTTVEAIAQLAADRRNGANGELAALSASALGIIERLAARPDPAPAPAPVVNVHMPEQPLSVNVEGARVEPHIHVPAQAAPVVNVAAPEAAPITVNVPSAEPATVQVDVHVPDQPPAPPIHVHVPATPPRVVRVVEDDETGERSFVSEDLQPAANE